MRIILDVPHRLLQVDWAAARWDIMRLAGAPRGRLARLTPARRDGGHLYTGPGRMISEQPSHPIVRHWGSVVDYRDEFYQAAGLSRDNVDVLLRFDPSSAPGSKLPPDGDFPLVWTKMYGQGRVVYSSLSHSTEAWDIRDLQIMMFEAIKWSLGLSEAAVQPHPKRDSGVSKAPEPPGSR